MEEIYWFYLGIGGWILFVIAMIAESCHVVHGNEVGVVERLGKPDRILQPGFHITIPIIEWVIGYVPSTDQWNYQKLPSVSCKTKDNYLLTGSVSIQYRVIDPLKAVYTLRQSSTYLEQATQEVLKQTNQSTLKEMEKSSAKKKAPINLINGVEFILSFQINTVTPPPSLNTGAVRSRRRSLNSANGQEQ